MNGLYKGPLNGIVRASSRVSTAVESRERILLGFVRSQRANEYTIALKGIPVSKYCKDISMVFVQGKYIISRNRS